MCAPQEEPVAYGIDDVFELTDDQRRALASCRIRTTGELLFACRDDAAVHQLAVRSGIDAQTIGRWALLADLMRINGIGRQFAELLLAAGIHSIDLLREQEPEQLVPRLQATNRQHRFSRTSPGQALVSGWIDQARFTRTIRRL